MPVVSLPRPPRPRRRLSLLLSAALGAVACGGPDAAAPPPELDDGEEPGGSNPFTPPSGGFYPRPGAPLPSFPPTAPPPALPRTGSVVALLDLPGGAALSPDGAAVRHALSTMGVPSEAVSDAAALGRYPVAVLTGDLSPAQVKASLAAQVAQALDGGTAVLAVAPSSERLYALAGISEGSYRADRTALALEPVHDPATATLGALGLPRLVLGSGGAEIQGRGYYVSPAERAVVLARFDDGSAALVRRGRLYVLGLRTRYHGLLMSGNSLGLAAHAEAGPPVQGALLPLLLRDLYAGHAPRPQVRQLAPDGRRAAVILTHDCDSPRSVERVPELLAVEQRAGVRSTFLLTTSPYSNGHTGRVYTAEMMAVLRDAIGRGFDLGTHTFGHLPDFGALPARTSAETAAGYIPTFRRGASRDASLFAEFQLSRWLVEADLGVTVSSFRPAHMLLPPSYYEDLRAAGYQRSSGRMAAIVRTSFPHQAPGAEGAAVHPVIEYPLSLTDSQLRDDNVAETVARWLAAVDQNARMGAPTMLLLHASSRPGKVAALQAFLDGLAGRDLWVGDWQSYARFYESQGF